jgi:putative glutamine amidotransferase
MATKVLRTGIAYPAFFTSFLKHFPGLSTVRGAEDVKNYDLIIFSGGEDLNPALYGQKPTHTHSWSEERDRIESVIFSEAKSRKIKMLGTCRGHQIINVCLGGDLYQDIYMEAGASHGGEHGWEPEINHPVLSTLGPSINSYHHQGVYRQASGMICLANYKGIPEVSISTDNKILTVQFHPEFSDMIAFFEYIKSWVWDTSQRPACTLSENKTKKGPTTRPSNAFVRMSSYTEVDRSSESDPPFDDTDNDSENDSEDEPEEPDHTDEGQNIQVEYGRAAQARNILDRFTFTTSTSTSIPRRSS